MNTLFFNDEYKKIFASSLVMVCEGYVGAMTCLIAQNKEILGHLEFLYLQIKGLLDFSVHS